MCECGLIPTCSRGCCTGRFLRKGGSGSRFSEVRLKQEKMTNTKGWVMGKGSKGPFLHVSCPSTSRPRPSPQVLNCLKVLSSLRNPTAPPRTFPERVLYGNLLPCVYVCMDMCVCVSVCVCVGVCTSACVCDPETISLQTRGDPMWAHICHCEK